MLKYKDIFQSELVGFTSDGHAVLRKKYYSIEANPQAMVHVDAEHNKATWAQHGNYVLIIDLSEARAGLTRLVRYARAFDGVEDVVPPDAVHVLHSPAWCRATWRVLRRIASAQVRDTVHFHAGGTEELEGTGHLPVRSPPLS